MRRLSAMMPFVVLTLATTLFEGKPSQGQQQATGREIPSVRLQGSGASFPAPLYETWFKRFSALHRDVRLDYQAVGSGAGVKDFTNELVDFGASDAAITPNEMERVERGVQPIPMTAGAIVLVHSVPGVDELRLSREAYSAIFLGECTRWDDPRITRTNPGVEIPDLPIMVVVRADGSGTTHVFTKHLAAVSGEFSQNIGFGKTVRWPDDVYRAPKNDGVTAAVKGTKGSIGYVEYGYAQAAGMKMASLENRAGNMVAPTVKSFQAALAAIDLPENLIAWDADPQGRQAYPIVTYTWLLCYKRYENEAKLDALKDLLMYCLSEGQRSSARLGYVPLPETKLNTIRKVVMELGR